MKIKLKEDFQYSPNGSETITAKKGDILEGDPANWAMAQDKGERVAEKARKAPQAKVKPAAKTADKKNNK